VDQAALENPGVHEQSYNYFQWHAALKKASLKPRFSFPAYYQAVLDGHAGASSVSGWFGKLARRIWRSPLRSVIVAPGSLHFLQIFLGINVCVLAKKVTHVSPEGSN
jgi:hypothetical protein